MARTRRNTSVKQIAPKSSNDRFQEVLEYITLQLRPCYKNGLVPTMIKETQLSALISISTSSLQKNRGKYLPGSKDSPLPPYCKIPGGGVAYRLTDVVDWYLRLNQQSAGGDE